MSYVKTYNPVTILSQTQWQSLQVDNYQSLVTTIDAHRQRVQRGEKHPIIDFLFEYYHFKPAKLLEWSPGLGIILRGSSSDEFLNKRAFTKSTQGVFVAPEAFPDKRREGLEWTINLLKQTLVNQPVFKCFGLHEWCMIYDKSDIRHPNLPLRLAHNEIRETASANTIQCTHYDAYRFYSNDAKVFNHQALHRADMLKNEQPGCLHNNMDLYRWAYKYYPWIGSDIIREAFLLAVEIRSTDMRASPYDVSEFTNLPAIKVETNQGKSEYIQHQRHYFAKAQVIRKSLLQKLLELREMITKIK